VADDDWAAGGASVESRLEVVRAASQCSVGVGRTAERL